MASFTLSNQISFPSRSTIPAAEIAQLVHVVTDHDCARVFHPRFEGNRTFCAEFRIAHSGHFVHEVEVEWQPHRQGKGQTRAHP